MLLRPFRGLQAQNWGRAKIGAASHLLGSLILHFVSGYSEAFPRSRPANPETSSLQVETAPLPSERARYIGKLSSPPVLSLGG